MQDDVKRIMACLTTMPSMWNGWFVVLGGAVWPWAFGVAREEEARRLLAERLRRAGWSPGMPSTEAFRLLGKL